MFLTNNTPFVAVCRRGQAAAENRPTLRFATVMVHEAYSIGSHGALKADYDSPLPPDLAAAKSASAWDGTSVTVTGTVRAPEHGLLARTLSLSVGAVTRRLVARGSRQWLRDAAGVVPSQALRVDPADAELVRGLRRQGHARGRSPFAEWAASPPRRARAPLEPHGPRLRPFARGGDRSPPSSARASRGPGANAPEPRVAWGLRADADDGGGAPHHAPRRAPAARGLLCISDRRRPGRSGLPRVPLACPRHVDRHRRCGAPAEARAPLLRE